VCVRCVCVVVCRSVVQCGAVQGGAVWCSGLQSVDQCAACVFAVCCSVLQCFVVCCSVSQCGAVVCRVWISLWTTNVAAWCSVMQFGTLKESQLEREGAMCVSLIEYRLFYRALLQKRPIVLRSLLIVANRTRRCHVCESNRISSLS